MMISVKDFERDYGHMIAEKISSQAYFALDPLEFNFHTESEE